MRYISKALIFVWVVASFVACNGSTSSEEVNSELQTIVSSLALTGDPTIGRTLPEISSPQAQLGMKLFFARSLGGDGDAACVTCHHPLLGGGDDLPLSIGVGAVDPSLLGPGRVHPDGDFTVPRNAPSTFNLALWDSSLFWDGRTESLGKTPGMNGDDGMGIRTPDTAFGVADSIAGTNISTAQARFPVTSPEEMRGFEFVAGGSNQELRAALEQRLRSAGSWAEEFQSVYGATEITFDKVAAALAEYERSQIFVDTPWKRYVEGDAVAISLEAKRGALLFFKTADQGGANCFSCHSGDFFTDEQYHSILAPQIGRGKGDGTTGTNDFGRERETGDRADRFAFRTPTLLNVAVTEPYTHAGAFSTLEEVIVHHLDPVEGLAGYDFANAMQAVTTDFEVNMDEIISASAEDSTRVISTFLNPVQLGEQEVQQLVAFLEALTDPCVLDPVCLAAWIPAEGAADPDDTQLKPRFGRQ